MSDLVAMVVRSLEVNGMVLVTRDMLDALVNALDEAMDAYAELLESEFSRPPACPWWDHFEEALSRGRAALTGGPGSPQWAEECEEFGCHDEEVS